MKKHEKEILLAEIADTIRLRVEKELDSPGLEAHGLYSGAFGLLLFLSRYRKYAENKEIYTRLHDRYLEKCLDEIASGRLNISTFCNGLSGALYLLKNEYASEIDISEAEIMLDNYLLRNLKGFFVHNNWDFLHGALGIGYYYLLRDDKDEVHNLLLDYLEEHGLEEGGCRKILSYSFLEKRGEYNISLSHGMSSIVGYLSVLYQKMPQERVKRLLTEYTTFIIRQQIEFNIYGSCFPGMSLEQTPLTRSRLAWCYGDLGVACALYRAAVALQNDEWIAIALSVFDKNTTRRNFDQAMVKDACVCHGSAGIALIFAEMYRRIPKQEYKECADYWLEQTMLMTKFEDGLAGFKTYKPIPEKNQVYVNEYNMLEGIAGIGLVMMTFMYGEEWSDMLMI